MKINNTRIYREGKTVCVMIALYCSEHHFSQGLCLQCEELLNYARDRLDKCPFGRGKTTCTKCPVHCYLPEMRNKIIVVMRYSGPRMLYRHPLLTIQHIIDGFRRKPLNIKE
jgi:hypothetical protein